MTGSGKRGMRSLGSRLAPPRFLVFLALFVAGSLGWWLTHRGAWADALVLGFDGGALVFLGSLGLLMRVADAPRMRRSALENDANRVAVLCVTSILTVVIMVALSSELPRAAHGDSLAKVRLIGTLMLTWLVANAVYGLHYAHLYYSRDAVTQKDRGGIQFPATDAPDYFDFAYFSFTLGMTFQTSDVAITSQRIRRIVTLHSFAAFVFNLGVIAFTINALGAS